MEVSGPRVIVRTLSVLAVPHELGRSYVISVAHESSPCLGADEDLRGLSLEEELEGRGGFTISGDELAQPILLR
jgi:hypothetical protein